MRSAEAAFTLALLVALVAWPSARAADCASFRIDGDGIAAPLDGAVGNPDRGREVALDRTRGDCTICHLLPLPGRRFHGTVGPSLDAVGARLDAAQIRLRIAAPKRLNPHTVMPAYCTTGNRYRVAAGLVGRPILSAGEIEDLVAWLRTLDGSEPIAEDGDPSAETER